jgi:hypothetical protein
LTASGDSQRSEIFHEPVEAFCVIEILAQQRHFFGGNPAAAIASLLPALVFVVRAVAHRSLAIGGGSFAVFFGQRAAFDRTERSEFREDRLALRVGK